MKIGIYTNKKNDPECKLSRMFALAAAYAGFECGGQFDCGFDSGSVKQFRGIREMAAWADVVAVIGGDGTILAVADTCARNDVPILAIHNGSLGFMTEILTSEIKESLKLIAENKFAVEERTMIETKFDGETYIALNEVLIARKNRSGICKLSAYCDDVYFDTYCGDGVIVSTATGSTGYSLSAGGPVLSPKLDALVLTPLCAHALNSRSIVFSSDEVLTITIDGRDDFNCIHVDGKLLGKDIKAGTAFTIKKSNFKTKFIRLSEKSFYARMYAKLESWNRKD